MAAPLMGLHVHCMSTDTLYTLRNALLVALGLGAGPAVASPRGEAATLAVAPVCATDIPGHACHFGDPDASTCQYDADCTDGPNGRCIQGFGMVGWYCGCEYACATDADCSPGEACVCGESLGLGAHSACVSADCQDGSECVSGQCELSVYDNGCGEELTLACRSSVDACSDDADCPVDEVCAYDGSVGAWTCQGLTCIIGRPLVVEGEARSAPSTPRADWVADIRPDGEAPPEVAEALARYWTDVAALEHASVASFARFTLELLAQGAPPELVADAQRAALDEIEHARLAWALASAWSGRPVGPGPLSVTGVQPAQSLDEMVAALVKEGCVGETLGAAEARLIAEDVEDPVLASALRRVAEDEQRHAELAWRTLRWLLSVHGTPVRDIAMNAASEAATEILAPGLQKRDGVVAPAWGLVSEATTRQRRHAMLDGVVRPVLEAALDLPLAA